MASYSLPYLKTKKHEPSLNHLMLCFGLWGIRANSLQNCQGTISEHRPKRKAMEDQKPGDLASALKNIM